MLVSIEGKRVKRDVSCSEQTCSLSVLPAMVKGTDKVTEKTWQRLSRSLGGRLN